MFSTLRWLGSSYFDRSTMGDAFAGDGTSIGLIIGGEARALEHLQ